MFCSMVMSQKTASDFLYFLDFAEVLQWCYRCQKLCRGEIWPQITPLRRQQTQHPAAAAGWAPHSSPELWAAKLVTETSRKQRVFPGCIFNDSAKQLHSKNSSVGKWWQRSSATAHDSQQNVSHLLCKEQGEAAIPVCSHSSVTAPADIKAHHVRFTQP